MEGQLYLARDGVLRVHHVCWDPTTRTRSSFYIPIELYERYLHNAFLKCIDRSFEMEDNLTVRELFTNLQPYSDFLEGLGCMDFAAFAEESRKPPTSMEDRHRFKHIQVEAFYELRAEPEYERVEQEEVEPDVHGKYYSTDALFRSLGMGQAIKTNRVTSDKVWTNAAMLREPEEDENFGTKIYSYSISYTPVCNWSHLPLYIKPTASMRDETQLLDFMTTDEPLFNPNHPMVTVDEHGSGKILTIELEEPSPSFRDAIIKGCLFEWGFHYSPMQRDEAMRDIERASQEIDDDLDDVGTNLEVDEDEDDSLSDRDVYTIMNTFCEQDSRCWKHETQDDS